MGPCIDVDRAEMYPRGGRVKSEKREETGKRWKSAWEEAPEVRLARVRPPAPRRLGTGKETVVDSVCFHPISRWREGWAGGTGRKKRWTKQGDGTEGRRRPEKCGERTGRGSGSFVPATGAVPPSGRAGALGFCLRERGWVCDDGKRCVMTRTAQGIAEEYPEAGNLVPVHFSKVDSHGRNKSR